MARNLSSTTRPLQADCPTYPSDELIAVLKERDAAIVTFVGFGELGYEDERAMRALVRRELRDLAPLGTVVNTGTLVTHGFHSGIASVYEDAKSMGFRTCGVHPSIALREPERHRVSAYCDETFFVLDESWGGYLPGTRQPSPTLCVLAAISSKVVAIGGGRHAAEELQEFLERGVPVRFYEAEMDHAVGADWYGRQGVADVDFGGHAHRFWRSRERA